MYIGQVEPLIASNHAILQLRIRIFPARVRILLGFCGLSASQGSGSLLQGPDRQSSPEGLPAGTQPGSGSPSGDPDREHQGPDLARQGPDPELIPASPSSRTFPLCTRIRTLASQDPDRGSPGSGSRPPGSGSRINPEPTRALGHFYCSLEIRILTLRVRIVAPGSGS